MNVFVGASVKLGGIVLLASTLSLGGCLGGPAPQDHFYRLELPGPTTRLDPPPLNGTLQVTRPWADALTSERQLLFRQNHGSSRLHRHAYHRWVDSPTLILQQEIARYLRRAHIAKQVVTPELRVKVDYVLNCRIAKLEQVLDDSPRVVMELELSITHVNDRQALMLETYHEEQATESPGISASVIAYTHALTNILNRFLDDSSRLGGGGNPSTIP